eukprot:1931700-Prymnesium_polylepis.1
MPRASRMALALRSGAPHSVLVSRHAPWSLRTWPPPASTRLRCGDVAVLVYVRVFSLSPDLSRGRVGTAERRETRRR